MENINWIAIFTAGLVPTFMGYLWYGPILGKQWMASTGKTEQWYIDQGGMGKILAMSIVLSIFLSFILNIFILTTHGNHFMAECSSIIGTHATFGHGALHGAMYSAMWIIPVFVINGMFERRGPKNYWIHISYWVISCAIMGGILDVWR